MKIDNSDLKECKLLIKEGSHSFYAASKLLPKYVRDPAIVLYAFCRIADDVVDQESKLKNPIQDLSCLLYTSPSPRDRLLSRMPSSA